MNDEWEDLMPDSGENGITFGEALRDTMAFFAKVLGALLFVALVIGLFAYGIWREFAIISFLTRS